MAFLSTSQVRGQRGDFWLLTMSISAVHSATGDTATGGAQRPGCTNCEPDLSSNSTDPRTSTRPFADWRASDIPSLQKGVSVQSQCLAVLEQPAYILFPSAQSPWDNLHSLLPPGHSPDSGPPGSRVLKEVTASLAPRCESWLV